MRPLMAVRAMRPPGTKKIGTCGRIKICAFALLCKKQQQTGRRRKKSLKLLKSGSGSSAPSPSPCFCLNLQDRAPGCLLLGPIEYGLADPCSSLVSEG
jgi:hypothetical protein